MLLFFPGVVKPSSAPRSPRWLGLGEPDHPAELVQSCLKVRFVHSHKGIDHVSVCSAAVAMEVIVVEKAAWCLLLVKRAERGECLADSLELMICDPKVLRN